MILDRPTNRSLDPEGKVPSDERNVPHIVPSLEDRPDTKPESTEQEEPEPNAGNAPVTIQHHGEVSLSRSAAAPLQKIGTERVGGGYSVTAKGKQVRRINMCVPAELGEMLAKEAVETELDERVIVKRMFRHRYPGVSES